jgi:exopolyphosphatase/guanosine-5'-triphosphate,3'-diphosphate pyrophosphatase
MKRRIAVIDIGTNSVLYLLAEKEPGGGVRGSFQQTEGTRLGEGLQRTRTIGEAPLKKTLIALNRYRALSELHQAEKTVAVGTHLFRAAQNSREIIRAIERECGLAVEVLSEDGEAEWSYRGATHGRSLAEPAVAVDVGGGSTEAVLGDHGLIRRTCSLPWGAVSLTERFLPIEPPGGGALDALKAFAAESVRREFGPFLRKGKSCVATGGTATTLAAFELGLDVYDPDRADGTVLSEAAVAGRLHALAAVPLEERKKMIPFDPARADILVAGAVLLHAVMKEGSFRSIFVSDRSLRFGIALREFIQDKEQP